ncbi:MAG: hypothetical protein KY396_06500 [Actinobacteria bacterium]|nr:hypothetical protein [Actinomycetota bacterium]
MRTELRPPSGGTPPPESITLAGGERLFLAPIAHEAALRFRREFPDEEERYGDAGFAWCVHDTQYLLAWALTDAEIGGRHFEKNLEWLTRLLDARGYPAERIARDLEIVADVLHELHPDAREALTTLRRGAVHVRAPGTGS